MRHLSEIIALSRLNSIKLTMALLLAFCASGCATVSFDQPKPYSQQSAILKAHSWTITHPLRSKSMTGYPASTLWERAWMRWVCGYAWRKPQKRAWTCNIF